jgi:hypothetical protein
MSILLSLAKAYERIPHAPPFGYSSERISFVISLNDDGSVATVVDLRTRQKENPASDAGSCIIQAARHYSKAILSLGQYGFCPGG